MQCRYVVGVKLLQSVLSAQMAQTSQGQPTQPLCENIPPRRPAIKVPSTYLSGEVGDIGALRGAGHVELPKTNQRRSPGTRDVLG